MPEKEKVQTMTDGSGLIAETSLPKCNLHGVFLKTSKGTSRWDSLQLSQTWQNLVTRERSAFSARLKSAHLTRENESSSWQSPKASDPEHSGPNMRYSNGGMPLPAQVLNAQTPNWGTPRVTTNGGHPSPQCTGRGSRLEDQVAMSLEPSVSKAKEVLFHCGCGHKSKMDKKTHLTIPCPDCLMIRDGSVTYLYGQPVPDNHNTNGKSQESKTEN